MAQEYDNNNRGQIWSNKKKESDKHPDFTGTLNVEGTEYWVSAWKRKPDANEKAPALSFSIKVKDEKPAAKPEKPAKSEKQTVSSDFSDFDSDIPFAPHGKNGAGVGWRML